MVDVCPGSSIVVEKGDDSRTWERGSAPDVVSINKGRAHVDGRWGGLGGRNSKYGDGGIKEESK